MEHARTSTRAMAQTAAAAERRRDLVARRAEAAGVRVRFGRFGRIDSESDDDGDTQAQGAGDAEEGSEHGEFSQMDADEEGAGSAPEAEGASGSKPDPRTPQKARSSSPIDVQGSARRAAARGGSYGVQVGAL